MMKIHRPKMGRIESEISIIIFCRKKSRTDVKYIQILFLIILDSKYLIKGFSFVLFCYFIFLLMV
jgi:hypothetical protein